MEPVSSSSSSSEHDEDSSVTADSLLRLVEATEKMRITIDDSEALKKRSKYIPLRLTAEERKLFQILQGGLEISEYEAVLSTIDTLGTLIMLMCPATCMEGGVDTTL